MSRQRFPASRVLMEASPSEQLQADKASPPSRCHLVRSKILRSCLGKSSAKVQEAVYEEQICIRSVRHTQIYLVAASRLMCYLARAQLGALLPFLTAELRLTSIDQGYLMSRYASGYILTQIVGGMLADKFGGYIVVAIVIACTALCCIFVQISVSFGITVFGLPFFFMGLCQGAVMPAGNVLIARWALPSERSWASAVSGMGSCIGTLLINLIAAPIASRFGWRAVFSLTVCICVAFFATWLQVAGSSPDACRRISHEELTLLQEAGLASERDNAKVRVASPATTPIKLQSDKSQRHSPFFNRSLFLHTSVWIVIFAHFVQNCQQAFADWLPLFYDSQLGVNADLASFYLTVIASVELPARTATKSLPEIMGRSGMTLLRCRKIMSFQGFFYHLIVFAIVAVFLFSGVSSPSAFAAFLALSKAAQAFHAGGYFANYLDLTRNSAGMLTGIGNTIASLAGIIVPRFVAFSLQDGGNWLPGVIALVGLDFLAMIGLLKFMSTKCLDDASVQVKEDCNGHTNERRMK